MKDALKKTGRQILFLFVVGEEKKLVLGLKILEIVGELLEISKIIGNL